MLATGLMAGARGRATTLRRGSGLGLTGLLLAAVVAAAGGVGLTSYVLAQDGVDDETLIDNLVAIEEQVPTPLPPDQVVIAPDQTFAEFIGDFTGAKVALDQIAPDARQLFIEADEADGEVADAVADVARGYVLLQNAFTYLAAWEGQQAGVSSTASDLLFPLDTFDETGTATGADDRRAFAQIGLQIQIDAYERMLPAYQVLRDTEAADASERALLDGRFETLETANSVLIPNIHRALSEQTTQVLATVERFETDAPGVEARARSMVITCIDRDAYRAVQTAALTDPEGQAAEILALLEAQNVTVDCPDLKNGNEVRPRG